MPTNDVRKLGNGRECPLTDGKIKPTHSRTAILNQHYKKHGEDDASQIWHSDCYVLFITEGFDIEKAKVIRQMEKSTIR